MLCLTFDTGALIALERGDKRMRVVLDAATADRVQVTVPAVVGVPLKRPAVLSVKPGGNVPTVTTQFE